MTIQKIRTKLDSRDPEPIAIPRVPVRGEHMFLSFQSLTEDDVRKLIKQSPNKQCSSDPIPTLFLKVCLDSLLPLLTLLVKFQYIPTWQISLPVCSQCVFVLMSYRPCTSWWKINIYHASYEPTQLFAHWTFYADGTIWDRVIIKQLLCDRKTLRGQLWSSFLRKQHFIFLNIIFLCKYKENIINTQ